MTVPDTVPLAFVPFNCSCCGRILRVAVEFAGESVRCPVCRTMAIVPGTVTGAAASPTAPPRQNSKPTRGARRESP